MPKVTAYIDGKISLFLLTPQQHRLLITMITTAFVDWQLANLTIKVTTLARMGHPKGKQARPCWMVACNLVLTKWSCDSHLQWPSFWRKYYYVDVLIAEYYSGSSAQANSSKLIIRNRAYLLAIAHHFNKRGRHPLQKRLSSCRQAKGWLFFWNLFQCFAQWDALLYVGDRPLNSIWIGQFEMERS